MATAMEATPRRARGIVAGFTQQGFAAGYMLASGFNLAMGKNYLTTIPPLCPSTFRVTYFETHCSKLTPELQSTIDGKHFTGLVLA